MSNCRVCTAPIRWATGPGGRPIPLDEHEQLDYDPPRPPVASPVELGPKARYRIVQDGARPIVEPVPDDSPARTYVDHRWLCMQPRAI
jgi:hypothetical protein